MVGSTQMVDMVRTRKNDFGHILVAVLDPALVPFKMDVVIRNHYFDLEIEMEKVGFDDRDGGEGKEDENAADKKDDRVAKLDDATEEDNNALDDLGANSLGNNLDLETI
jgi:hypothetical protein